MGISNMTLAKIAGIGGIITVSMGYAVRMQVNNEICKTEYYRDAMKTLRRNKAAVHLLGEPIRDKLLDLDDTTKNYTEEINAHYEVPVKGPKDRGVMFFWASRPDHHTAWNVDRIELELKSDTNRRLVVK